MGRTTLPEEKMALSPKAKPARNGLDQRQPEARTNALLHTVLSRCSRPSRTQCHCLLQEALEDFSQTPQSVCFRAGKILPGLGIAMGKEFTQLESEFLNVKLSAQSSGCSPSFGSLEPHCRLFFCVIFISEVLLSLQYFDFNSSSSV